MDGRAPRRRRAWLAAGAGAWRTTLGATFATNCASGALHARDARSRLARTRDQLAPEGPGGPSAPPPGNSCCFLLSPPSRAAWLRTAAPRTASASCSDIHRGTRWLTADPQPPVMSLISCGATAKAVPTLGHRPPLAAMHPPAFAVAAARRGSPARPPRCLMQSSWDCMEEGRRLAGPGLGGVVVDVVSTKAVGRPPPRHAALSCTTVGAGREWARQRRSLRGPSDERPRPRLLTLRLNTIIVVVRRRAGVPSFIMRSPIPLLSMIITHEKAAGWRAGGVVMIRG